MQYTQNKCKAMTRMMAEQSVKMRKLELNVQLLTDEAKTYGGVQRQLDTKVAKHVSTRQAKLQRESALNERTQEYSCLPLDLRAVGSAVDRARGHVEFCWTHM